MKYTVTLPWRDLGCHYRKKAFEFTRKYYEKAFNVKIASSNEHRFSRAALRNIGAQQCDSDVYIVIDADLIIPYDQIFEAIDKAKVIKTLIKPFDLCGYMDPASTEKFYDLKSYDKLSTDDFTYWMPLWPKPVGGSYVISIDSWTNINGMDDEFVGWGGEDDAFNYKCEMLLGKTIHIEGPAFHLYHPSSRVCPIQNHEILKDYANRYSNPADKYS